MRKRRRRYQITCWCSRYLFPHRLGGGRCHGREWAESYMEHDGRECRDCPLYDRPSCDVAAGAESIKHCPGVAEFFRAEDRTRHPVYEDVRIYQQTIDVAALLSCYDPDDMPF